MNRCKPPGPAHRPCRTHDLVGALVVCVLATLAVALVPAPAAAATAADIPVQSYTPPAGARDGLMVPSAQPQGDGTWALLASLHYARRPLAFVNDDGGSSRVQTVVGDLWMVDIGGSLGWQQWTFEAVMPTALVLRGGGPNLVQIDPPRAPAFGDLRLGVRRGLWQRAVGDWRYDVAASVGYPVPTAATGSWLGNGGSRVDIDLLGSVSWGPWLAHLDLGVHLRSRQSLVADQVDAAGQPVVGPDGRVETIDVLSVGSEQIARLAVARSLLDQQLWLRVEMQGAWGLSADTTAAQGLFDLLVGADWRLTDAWHLFAAVGGAATGGYGSAQARTLAGVRLLPGMLPSDRDGDRVEDRVDRCPDQAEDADGFEDADGCPDPDNDGDGIADNVDGCPNMAEDKDQFEDSDGCPEADNDGDGIIDGADGCPVEAEDKDGFEDSDGCPDADNDGDGLADVDDMCPLAAEILNGFEDGDGCPDVAPQPEVRMDGAEIILREKIVFVAYAAELTAVGRARLDPMVRFLREHPEIELVQVTGHTDNNGATDALMALSAARAEAVRDFVVQAGPFEAARFTARGAGSTVPLASNETPAGRSRNRRISIEILRQKLVPVVPKPQRVPAPVNAGPEPRVVRPPDF